MKNFKKNGGFTLVELIVVIAILAILAAVAVPAYSGYISKTNMTADQTLVSQVAHAIELGYYAGTVTEGGFVVIGGEGTAPSLAGGTISSQAYEDCLVEAFGNLGAVALKYDDWNVDYQGSSYHGQETALLGQVNNLTNALETYLAGATVEGNFANYVNTNFPGATNTQKANAAVLYVAENTSNKNASSYLAAVQSGNAQSIFTTSDQVFGTGVVGTANLYALAEGYFRYEAQKTGDSTNLDNLHNAIQGPFANQNDAYAAVLGAFNDANVDADASKAYFEGGANSQAVKDAKAYMDIMGTVTSAKGQLSTEIKAGNAIGTSQTVANLMAHYASGSIIVIVEEQTDGTLKVINPLAEN